MAGDTLVTFIGNLTDDPELRFTPSGAAVANFTVASTPRRYDKQSNEWVDLDPIFLRCSIWRQEAENVAESLTKGSRVVVQGRLRCRPYETRDNEKRWSWELEVEEVGASLKWATARLTRTTRQSSGQTSRNDPGQGGGGGGDPWAQPSAGGGQPDPWASQSDEPPF